MLKRQITKFTWVGRLLEIPIQISFSVFPAIRLMYDLHLQQKAPKQLQTALLGFPASAEVTSVSNPTKQILDASSSFII